MLTKCTQKGTSESHEIVVKSGTKVVPSRSVSMLEIGTSLGEFTLSVETSGILWPCRAVSRSSHTQERVHVHDI